MTEIKCTDVECITERQQAGNLRDQLARRTEALRVSYTRNHLLMRIIRRQDKLLRAEESK